MFEIIKFVSSKIDAPSVKKFYGQSARRSRASLVSAINTERGEVELDFCPSHLLSLDGGLAEWFKAPV
jgi:hypothetical protein